MPVSAAAISLFMCQCKSQNKRKKEVKKKERRRKRKEKNDWPTLLILFVCFLFVCLFVFCLFVCLCFVCLFVCFFMKGQTNILREEFNWDLYSLWYNCVGVLDFSRFTLWFSSLQVQNKSVIKENHVMTCNKWSVWRLSNNAVFDVLSD